MNAFRGALSDYDLPIPDDQRLRTYVGPPLWYSFSDLGYEGELLANLVSGYRARYQAHYLDPEPFPGVIELLHDLHRADSAGDRNVEAGADGACADGAPRIIRSF